MDPEELQPVKLLEKSQVLEDKVKELERQVEELRAKVLRGEERSLDNDGGKVGDHSIYHEW